MSSTIEPLMTMPPNKRKLEEMTKEEGQDPKLVAPNHSQLQTQPQPSQLQSLSAQQSTLSPPSLSRPYGPMDPSLSSPYASQQLTPDSLDRKKGRGGKREGAGRKKKGPPTPNSTPVMPIRPSPTGAANGQLIDDPVRMFRLSQSQVPPPSMHQSPFLPRIDAGGPSSPSDKDEDISIDELVASVVILNQKFVRYTKRESQVRQQYYAQKKEKEELQWRLNEALKAKEALEHQIANLDGRLQEQFLIKSSENGEKPDLSESSPSLTSSSEAYSGLTNEANPQDAVHHLSHGQGFPNSVEGQDTELRKSDDNLHLKPLI